MLRKQQVSQDILLDPDSDTASIHVSKDLHIHPEKPNRNKTNLKEAKEEVLRLINAGVTKPKKILKELKNKQLTLTKAQLYNLKARENVKKNGKSTVTLNEWLDWVKDRLEVPEDEDEMYIVDYHYSIKDGSIKEIKLFCTTKRLIKFTMKGKIN